MCTGDLLTPCNIVQRRERMGLAPLDTDPELDDISDSEWEIVEDPPELVAARLKLAAFSTGQDTGVLAGQHVQLPVPAPCIGCRQALHHAGRVAVHLQQCLPSDVKVPECSGQ